MSKPAGKPAEVIEAEKAAAAAEEKRLADEAKARRAAAAEASARAKAEKQAAAEAKKAKSDKPKPEATTVTSPVTLAPVEPPPSAVSASKEAKLAELLRKYKSDSITPDEYHKERARILAEP